MGKRSLLKDVSVDELLHMRESGMTNQDIANSLGVSRMTIYKYIGAQSFMGGGKVTRIPPESTRKQEPEPEAVLPVVERVTKLQGVMASYSISAKHRTVRMITNGTCMMDVPFDEWPAFWAEVEAIGRNLEKQALTPEMW